ncbi:hypothetical protein C0J52_21205 [Blattella germanica]|nr:hypothetical protein C0J52_21205 [Blattella germanica]
MRTPRGRVRGFIKSIYFDTFKWALVKSISFFCPWSTNREGVHRIRFDATCYAVK